MMLNGVRLVKQGTTTRRKRKKNVSSIEVVGTVQRTFFSERDVPFQRCLTQLAAIGKASGRGTWSPPFE